LYSADKKTATIKLLRMIWIFLHFPTPNHSISTRRRKEKRKIINQTSEFLSIHMFFMPFNYDQNCVKIFEFHCVPREIRLGRFTGQKTRLKVYGRRRWVLKNRERRKTQSNYTGSFHKPEVVLSPFHFQGEFTKM